MLLLEGDIFMRKVQSFYGGIEAIALHHFHLRRRGHNSSAIQGRAAIGLYENREGIWQLTPFIQPTLTNTERMHWGGKILVPTFWRLWRMPQFWSMWPFSFRSLWWCADAFLLSKVSPFSVLCYWLVLNQLENAILSHFFDGWQYLGNEKSWWDFRWRQKDRTFDTVSEIWEGKLETNLKTNSEKIPTKFETKKFPKNNFEKKSKQKFRASS